MPNPAEKVTKNLIHFAYNIPQEPSDEQGVLSLLWEDLEESVQVGVFYCNVTYFTKIGTFFELYRSEAQN